MIWSGHSQPVCLQMQRGRDPDPSTGCTSHPSALLEARISRIWETQKKLTVTVSLIDDGDINGDLAIMGGHIPVPPARGATLGQVDQVECRRQTCITATQDQDLERLSLGRGFKLGSHGVCEMWNRGVVTTKVDCGRLVNEGLQVRERSGLEGTRRRDTDSEASKDVARSGRHAGI